MPKYKAEPKPVRMTEGVTPRHSERTGRGPLRMFRKAWVRVETWDCCTRVFSKSAGCRRKALAAPDPRPATRWKAALNSVSDRQVKWSAQSSYRSLLSASELHLTWPLRFIDVTHAFCVDGEQSDLLDGLIEGNAGTAQSSKRMSSRSNEEHGPT